MDYCSYCHWCRFADTGVAIAYVLSHLSCCYFVFALSSILCTLRTGVTRPYHVWSASSDRFAVIVLFRHLSQH